MGSLLLNLLPLAVGIILSPLAVVAIVVIVSSHRGLSRGTAFTIGWVLAIALVTAASFWIARALELHPVVHQPPLWVPILHFLLAAVLLAAGAVILIRGRPKLRQLAGATTAAEVAAAAPRLPGWLRSVETFSFFKAALWGLGLFLISPVDLSCAIAAGLALAQDGSSGTVQIIAFVIYLVLAGISVIGPVLIPVLGGSKSATILSGLRSWISTHNGVLNAALLLLIGVMQLNKGIQSL